MTGRTHLRLRREDCHKEVIPKKRLGEWAGDRHAWSLHKVSLPQAPHTQGPRGGPDMTSLKRWKKAWRVHVMRVDHELRKGGRSRQTVPGAKATATLTCILCTTCISDRDC